MVKGEKPDVLIATSPGDLAVEFADQICRVLSQAIADRGRANFFLSGGSTPIPIYRELSSPENCKRLAWSNVNFYFGDERCVAPTHERSNYRMAKENLLDRLPISKANVHPIHCQNSPIATAEEYDKKVKALASIDLVHLGIGEDGHTASLFPGSPVLGETEKMVRVAQAPDGEVRVTLTPHALQQAREIFFLATGESKAETIRDVVNGNQAQPHPARQILMDQPGKVKLFLDKSSARELVEVPNQLKL